MERTQAIATAKSLSTRIMSNSQYSWLLAQLNLFDMTDSRHYSIRTIKETLPKDRLLVVKLEDGLGWEQICPFLDQPIPEEQYPRGNEPDKFHRIVGDYMEPRVKAAMVNFGAMVTATAGIAGYLGWRYYLRQ